MVMLGEPGVTEQLGGVPCFRRTWREVAGDSQRWSQRTSMSADKVVWATTIRDFLAQTDTGRIFTGLDDGLTACGDAPYRFSRLDLQTLELRNVGRFYYTYEAAT